MNCRHTESLSLGQPCEGGAADPAVVNRDAAFRNFWQNFGKIPLDFGCIGTDLCKKIVQNTRFAAFFKIYQIIKLKFLKLILTKIKFAKFAKFQKIQLENLVDFDKCCKTRIYLQRSAPIQPKTIEILPKIC